MRRGRHAPHSRRVAAVLVIITSVVAACTGGTDDPVATVPTTTTEPPQPRVDDGVLRIGALIPVNDPIGATLTTSFELAVGEVNDAGGFLGNDVEVIVEDEGASFASAAQATESLIELGVDAIVGPTSSTTAIGALDAATAAGIVTCSATATAITLDEYPDENLFFRSVATDSLQAKAIALEAQSEGAGRVVIIHVDDAYGQPYAAAVEEALSESIEVTPIGVPFGDIDLTDDLDEVAAARADTAIVLGSGEDIARLLEAIDTRDDIEFDQVIVNDAARTLSSRPVIASLSAELRSRIVGLTPQIQLPETSGFYSDMAFSSQITDCVNLIALAAAQGRSDNPATIASQMTSVSSGGDACRTFAECMALLDADENTQINYDGPTGITDLARDGDPARAFFDLFEFSADGSSEYDTSFAVTER